MGRASERHHAKIFEDILLSDFWSDKLMENFAIMPSLRGIGFKARNLGGIFLGSSSWAFGPPIKPEKLYAPSPQPRWRRGSKCFDFLVFTGY